MLVNTIILTGYLRIFSMAKDKNEYHTFHSLLNGDHVFTLDSDTLLAEVRQKTQASLSKSGLIYVIHDPSDIRK